MDIKFDTRDLHEYTHCFKYYLYHPQTGNVQGNIMSSTRERKRRGEEGREIEALVHSVSIERWCICRDQICWVYRFTRVWSKRVWYAERACYCAVDRPLTADAWH